TIGGVERHDMAVGRTGDYLWWACGVCRAASSCGSAFLLLRSSLLSGPAAWSLVRCIYCFFFFSSRRRHTRLVSDWSSDVCSSDLDRSLMRSMTPGAEASGAGVIDLMSDRSAR